MEDNQAFAHSNYFRVKDSTKFYQWAATRQLDVITQQKDGETYYSVSSTNQEFGGWCRLAYDNHSQDHTHVDFEAELATHLQDGSVAVLMEAGILGSRFVKANATAVNSKGEVEELRFDYIYEMGKHLGDEMTEVAPFYHRYE